MDRLSEISPTGWLALAAWVAVVLLVAALVYAWRAYQRSREQAEELTKPNVAMYMEPAPQDWHLIELVVKNFGQTPAYNIRFEWHNPPTVGRYEQVYDDRFVDIVPLNLPAEIPYLAPSQEWRIVWDSALDRRELGETIASRFDGAVTYYDRPKDDKRGKRNRYRSTAVLDWATLHPVERIELLTRHDLARQEKQKLELLRNLLTYYHWATRESREEVLRNEINRVRNAAERMREKVTSTQAAVELQRAQPRPADPPAPPFRPERSAVPARAARHAQPDGEYPDPEYAGYRDDAGAPVRPDDSEPQTEIINGRHRLV